MACLNSNGIPSRVPETGLLGNCIRKASWHHAGAPALYSCAQAGVQTKTGTKIRIDEIGIIIFIRSLESRILVNLDKKLIITFCTSEFCE